MIHKTLITAVVAATFGMFVFGTSFWSYVKSSANSVRETVKASVPLDVQIQTAHDMVEGILPQIREQKQMVAKQQVELKYLEEAISSTSKDLESQKRAILAMREMLDEGKQTYKFARHSYSSAEVESDVAQRFERFKIAEDALSREQKVYEAKRKALRSNELALDNMFGQKKNLEVQVVQLQARLNQIKATESVNSLEIDDSQLVRTRNMIHELNKQLDVKERMLDAEGEFVGLIPVEEELEKRVHANVLSEIDSYFSEGKTEEKSVEQPSVEKSEEPAKAETTGLQAAL